MLLFSVYVIDAYYLNCKRQDPNKNSKVNTGVEDEIVLWGKKKKIYEPHYQDYWDLFWKERVYKKNQTSMFQLVLNIATLGQ